MAAEKLEVFLEDLKSLNGTFVNGYQIQKYQLQRDDRMQVGGTLMRLEMRIGSEVAEGGLLSGTAQNDDADTADALAEVAVVAAGDDAEMAAMASRAAHVSVESGDDVCVESQAFSAEKNLASGKSPLLRRASFQQTADPDDEALVLGHENASRLFFDPERFSASGVGLDSVDVTMSSAGDQERILRTISHTEGEKFLSSQRSEKLKADGPWTSRAQGFLHLLYEMTLSISHCMDIDRLSRELLDLIFQWVDADRGCILLFDSNTNRLIPRAKKTRDEFKDQKLIISKTILDYVLEHREGVLTTNAKDDKRWDEAASVLSVGIHEAICVPLQGRYGIVGAIYLDTFSHTDSVTQLESHRFGDEHLKLMITIAHHTAIAVEDTRYYRGMLQAERLAAIGQTVATLSHHIKNILQGIQGGSYLIQNGLEHHNENFISKGWKIVERNQNRISSLILDMLTFSKDRKPELIPDSINRVVGEVVELMQDRAAKANVLLTWSPDEKLPLSLFDPEAMNHAVLNLVTNAIDAVVETLDQDGQVANTMKTVRYYDRDEHSGNSAAGSPVVGNSQGREEPESVFSDGSHIFDGTDEMEEDVSEEEAASGSCTSMPCGQIDVLTQYDSSRNVIRILVKDTGPGLTKEQVASIFRPFESSKGNRGTGLGLPVCKKIIREHGGTIHVEQRMPHGSRFIITLPVIQDS